MDAVLTTCPSPCSIKSGTKVATPWMTPHRFTPMIQRQSSSVTSQIGPPSPTPALLCTRCTAPNRSRAASRSARTDATSDTSVTTPIVSVPRCASSLTASFSGPSSMSARTIRMPSAAARSRDRLADAARAARDDRDLPLQVLHRALLRSVGVSGVKHGRTDPATASWVIRGQCAALSRRRRARSQFPAVPRRRARVRRRHTGPQ